MARGVVSRIRRTSLACAAFTCGTLAALLAATWAVGSSAWPMSETVESRRRLGTDVAVIEKRIADGDPSKALRIAVVGDIQNGITELRDLLEAYRAEDADFILQLGDAANKGLPGRYSVLRRMFEEHAPGIPVVAVPGNHDIEPDGTTDRWTDWVGPAEWRMDVRGWRIVGIDNAAGTISSSSLDLLREVASEPPPRCGTILVAHRPLCRTEGAEGREMVDTRARQVASTGIVATMTFSGHWHRNEIQPDAAGTLHYLIGESCDRSSAGDDPAVSKALLTLETGPGADGPGHRFDVERIERRFRVTDEFLRTAAGSFYPWLRERPWALWTTLLATAAAAALFARAALRPAASPAA